MSGSRVNYYRGKVPEPGCRVGKPKTKGGLMYLRAEGLRPESVRCTRPPKALGFPTQLPGEVLLATIRAWKILFSAQKACNL